MKRPDFTEIKTYEEFDSFYWYKEELQNICKSLDIEYIANKAELKQIIKQYYNGVKIPHKKITISKETTKSPLTLETKLIHCGFTFGPKFRNFFTEVTNDKNFKFTADMVASVKTAKNNNDTSFTLGDLLDVKTGKKMYAKYDNSSCQWNRFLKNFCEDKYNNIYHDKLKAASKFWALLRDSNLPKEYSREFIENNRNKI